MKDICVPFLSQIQQLEMQVIDAEKRAFTAHQQVRTLNKLCMCGLMCLHVYLYIQYVSM